jgi:hypothetical protein
MIKNNRFQITVCGVLLGTMVAGLVLPHACLAEQPFEVTIMSPYSELLHGEGVYFRVTVTNVSAESHALIRTDKLGQYGGVRGALYAEVFDTMGNRVRDGAGTLGSRRTALGVRQEDLVEIRAGET